MILALKGERGSAVGSHWTLRRARHKNDLSKGGDETAALTLTLTSHRIVTLEGKQDTVWQETVCEMHSGQPGSSISENLK